MKLEFSLISIIDLLYPIIAILILYYVLPPVFIIYSFDPITVTVIYSLSCLAFVHSIANLALEERKRVGVFEMAVSVVLIIQSIEYYIEMYRELVAIISGLGLFSIIGWIINWLIHRRMTNRLERRLDRGFYSLGEKIGSGFYSLGEKLDRLIELLSKKREEE